jgi:hypothetical protein
MRPLLLVGVFSLPLVLSAQTPSSGAAPPTRESPQTLPAIRRFDPLNLQLRCSLGRWCLYDGDRPLKEFGPVESEARQALRLIRDLKLNEYGLIGSPRPVMEYWLSEGKAPVAIPSNGLRMVPLDPSRLQVINQFGQWALKDTVRVLMTFATKGEARQALTVLRTYGFTQVGLLGQGVPSMTIFFGPSELHAGPVASNRPARTSTTPIMTNRAPLVPPSRSSDHPSATAKLTNLENVVGILPPIGSRSLSVAHNPLVRQTPLDPHDLRGSNSALAASRTAVWTHDPLPPDPDGRVAHDYRNIQLKQDQRGWSLVVGSQLIASFGVHVADARLAQSALQYYRCTEHYRLGGGFATHWVIVAPSSPTGVMFGLSYVPLDLDQLEVQEVSGQYALVEKGQVKAVIGPQAAEARDLLERIKRYQTDCLVGRGPDVMAFLVRSKPYAPRKEQAEQTAPGSAVAPILGRTGR